MLRAWAAARAQVRASRRARTVEGVAGGGLLACASALLALLFLGSRADKAPDGD